MSILLKPALTLHLLTETPASLTFLLTPHAQLPAASSDAVLILHNLGGLLFSTNLICLVLLFTTGSSSNTSKHNEEVNRLTAMVCLCLGTYHFWPLRRAWVRMRQGTEEGKRVLGGPVVHFGVHLVCLSALIGGGLGGLFGW